MSFSLEDLERLILSRAASPSGQSYTSQLLASGPERAAKKFGEESVEAVIAAIKNDRHELIMESADVLYHLLVLMRTCGVDLSDVLVELKRRTLQSGLQEKAGRSKD